MGYITRKLQILSASIQEGGLINGIKLIVSRILDNTLDCISYNSLSVNTNRILFFSTPDYSDNARALYDYMVSKNLDKTYDLIWAVSDSKKLKMLRKAGIKCVKQNAIFPSGGMHRLWYYGKTAKYIFHTHGHPFGVERKEGQTIINLWHGGMGFKIDKGAVHQIGEINNTSDYVLTSGNGKITEHVALSFHCCPYESLLPLGLPRNDLLFKSYSIQYLDSFSGKKILWMPTFRQAANKYISDSTLQSDTGLPILNTSSNLYELNKFLNEWDIHLFIKLHPLQIIEKIVHVELSHIHILTNSDLEGINVQLYEIMNQFDALITDYSSVSFDYLYLDRPIGYTLDDFEEYRESRGFPMDNPLDYMPGHHIYTYDDLIGFIQDVIGDKDDYASERDIVRKEVGMLEGGNCCWRILEFFEIN